MASLCLCVSSPPLPSPTRTLVTGSRATLTRDDLIPGSLTLYICKGPWSVLTGWLRPGAPLPPRAPGPLCTMEVAVFLRELWGRPPSQRTRGGLLSAVLGAPAPDSQVGAKLTAAFPPSQMKHFGLEEMSANVHGMPLRPHAGGPPVKLNVQPFRCHCQSSGQGGWLASCPR